MDEARLEYLFELYVSGAASLEEEQEFLQLAEMPENKIQLQALLDAFIKKTRPESEPSEVAEEGILQAIFQAKPKVVPMRRTWLKWVAAASIILVLGVGGYLFFVNKKSGDKGTETTVAKTNDVPAPKGSKAMITLADGTKVYLDSAGSGTIAQQGSVNVVRNENGEIVYSGEGTKAQDELVYNMAYNPRGSKVLPLTLNDGTKVWLNAESSLKYPAAFTGNTREVEIAGEAYFEVVHDATKPFKVKKGITEVTVLGTHFNVNAYDDEDALHVTLLEGSVAVKNESNNVRIRPGEQAIVTSDIKVKKDVDVDEVMAWKNGLFSFNNTDLKTVMRQIARWYDVDVEYQGNIPSKVFVGEIDRTVPVSKVLQMMEYVGVKFKIEGKRIVVTP